ncbi:Kielin/chordin-like protein-like 2 [Homarus americanus]|uniref:Kielin/chordin-like protein-like 2 n=1 Tax=Homarus americanus TaxID=6706 RepID=A0A8J5JIH5_HOMAM|nr:Kielin/chordin-like protein-like 2 [Homarus americanus]
MTCLCAYSGIVKSKKDCPSPGPRPNAGCKIVVEDCCQTWDCGNGSGGCKDTNGVDHYLGEEWRDLLDPCVHYLCTGEGIQVQVTDCPDPIVQPGCYPEEKEDVCCQTWNCPTCPEVNMTSCPKRVDYCASDEDCDEDHRCCQENCGKRCFRLCMDEDGVMHYEGEVWQDPNDPCTTLYCRSHGIDKISIYCRPGAPPHPTCILVSDGNCCWIWQCSSCVEDGETHEEGSQWSDPEDPCIMFTCTRGNIETHPIFCSRVPPPHPNCVLTKEDGECCPVWSCPSCTDDKGDSHIEGSTWINPYNPCEICFCINGTITKEPIVCLAYSPSSHCRQVNDSGCCPTWKCPNCVDEYGEEHYLGEEWSDPQDPCVHLRCTEDGIKFLPVECDLPPHPTCYPVLKDGDCCLTWRCPGICPPIQQLNVQCFRFQNDCRTDKDCKEEEYCCPVVCGVGCVRFCIDASGVRHDVGETWQDPEDPCTTFSCLPNGSIHNTTKICSAGNRPHYGCKLVEDGQCCWVWDCLNSTCPDPNSFGRNCLQYYDQCQSDLDCKSGMQCCLVAGCGKECMSGNDDRCPDTTGIVTPCVVTEEDCSTDEDCEGILRCCPYGCSKKCLVPGSECPTHCPPIHMPVCGSDGKVYSSECKLKQWSCRTPYLKKVKDEYC